MKIAVTNNEDNSVDQIEVHPLEIDGRPGDGKRLLIHAVKNDGWHRIDIEVVTDDCSTEFATKWAEWAVKTLNAALAKEKCQQKNIVQHAEFYCPTCGTLICEICKEHHQGGDIFNTCDGCLICDGNCQEYEPK